MTADGTLETTRRDLAVIRGWVFCPVPWQSVSREDNVLGRDGMVWHVRNITKHYATAQLWLIRGEHEHMIEVNLDDPVHVLQDSTGARSTEHAGRELVRGRKGRS